MIVDEAHSSQSGESTKSLKAVLATESLQHAEQEEASAETPEEEIEDRVLQEIQSRGRLPNLSTFAFTATPKPRTLELFGRKRLDGKFEPFHRYTMRQAIEEGFILDVLASYTTYTAYWRLLKKIEDDPRYDKKKRSTCSSRSWNCIRTPSMRKSPFVSATSLPKLRARSTGVPRQ